MFDSGVLVTLLFTIIIFYFTTYLDFAKEIDDLSESMDPNARKMKINRKDKIRKLNTYTVVMALIAVMLYLCKYVSIDGFPVKRTENFFLKIQPFTKVFMGSFNLKFSFITGIILTLILEILWGIFLNKMITPVYLAEYIFIYVCILVMAFGLVWGDYYLSLFLNQCILHYFPLLSVPVNLFFYILFGIAVWLSAKLITAILSCTKGIRRRVWNRFFKLFH